jgi:NADH-quinone oxidoreductase subunit M
MNDTFWLLTAIIFLPTAGALVLAFFQKEAVETMRAIGLVTTLVTLALSTYLTFRVYDRNDPGIQPRAAAIADKDVSEFSSEDIAKQYDQRGVSVTWVKQWNIHYRLGYDGISVPLVLLTGLISFLGMIASWSIQKEVKGYLILYLLLETGMMGVFLALDFFLFYVFWEVMLLPMYFLIGIWGGPRREYAAIKFFLYTLFGSVLMLIALLMLYFGSAGLNGATPTFNLMKLAAIGQGLVSDISYTSFIQLTAFVLLFIGFAIKVPVWPFHTWLPDAHVEAPTPISMILAGVLLKMGGYGILRVAFPICPAGAQAASYVLVALGVISIIYGAFAAMAQTDFKRLVAYSSVSHMGYVLLGIAVWKLTENGAVSGGNYWLQGLNGAMFQMIGHGISSAGMFFMVGVIYDRVHHRDLNKFGGLIGLMPLYGGLAVGLFFAGLGLPGLCGFIGEVFVVFSVWNYSPVLAIVAASGVILTAGYILWAVQRVYLGAEYKGPHPEAITPITERETFVAVVLLVFAIILGVFPDTLFSLMSASLQQFVATMDAGYQASLQAVTATASIK